MRLPLFSVSLSLAALLLFFACSPAVDSPVILDVAAPPKEKLSDYHFFTGDITKLQPNERVFPYALNASLFTDYAWKKRFFYLPPGASVSYQDSQVLQFPVGSCIIKNFYYPNDFRDESKGYRIMETRLLVHREKGWEAHEYVWNEEQTDAFLDDVGDIKPVSWIHYDGSSRKVDYLIPNKNQCKSCHWIGDKITPIGPKVQNLNRASVADTINRNQLESWATAKVLTGFPGAAQCTAWPDYMDTSAALDKRARAYLEINCGHCHNPKGPAYTSGLWLNIAHDDSQHLGVCKLPVAAGKATGGNLYDIVPGHPEQSILAYRMKDNRPEIRMPEVGRSVEHTEGVKLITEWITQMKGQCP